MLVTPAAAVNVAQLHSGLDHMFSVLGDAFPEEEMARMLIHCGFDAEAALSHLLDGTGEELCFFSHSFALLEQNINVMTCQRLPFPPQRRLRQQD